MTSAPPHTNKCVAVHFSLSVSPHCPYSCYAAASFSSVGLVRCTGFSLFVRHTDRKRNRAVHGNLRLDTAHHSFPSLLLLQKTLLSHAGRPFKATTVWNPQSHKPQTSVCVCVPFPCANKRTQTPGPQPCLSHSLFSLCSLVTRSSVGLGRDRGLCRPCLDRAHDRGLGCCRRRCPGCPCSYCAIAGGAVVRHPPFRRRRHRRACRCSAAWTWQRGARDRSSPVEWPRAAGRQ